MKNKMKFLIKIFFVGVVFISGVQFVNADTSFSFDIPGGQGGTNNEFYHGRCVRVDVMLNTDGHNTGGADLEINYDNSKIAIVNSDCSTPAATIHPDTQYQNYPNNHVTATKITLGAYNNPGIPYNGSGRFAYFYFTVLDGAGDYDLDFEFTLGNTTDTNLAEYGTGNDILDHADDYIVHFVDDNDIPYVNNENPAGGATGVQVISNILYRLNDDNAGINFSTLAQSLMGANWGTTNYTSASGQISRTCHTTNANRVPYCDTILNPTNNLYYCENYTVDISVSDLGNPVVHTLNNHNYNFDTESDDDATEIYNQNPNSGAVNISANSNIAMNVRDLANPGGYPGTGVNIATLSINVSAPGWGNQTYTTASPELTTTPVGVNSYGNVYDYSLVVDPATDFPENIVVTVTVDVDDYGCPVINHQHDVYTFTTADTQGPICTLFTPNPNVVNMGTADNVTFHCTDGGVGVNINTVSAVVDSVEYTAGGANTFTYVGTSADYFITVNPPADIALNYALEVIVNAQDFSGNHSDQVSFGLATGVMGSGLVCPTCKTCKTCETCEGTTETIVKYKECSVINNIIKENSFDKFLPAKSKIANTQIQGIKLITINDINISVGNQPKNNLLTALVDKGTTKEALVTIYDEVVIFQGTSIPNTQVTLMIESSPLIVSGLVDNDGKWQIETVNIFKNGIHKVSAVTMSNDNYVVKKKFLANFEIKRGGFSWWCLAMILILLLLLWWVYRKYRKFKKLYCELKSKEKVCLRKKEVIAKRNSKRKTRKK